VQFKRAYPRFTPLFALYAFFVLLNIIKVMWTPDPFHFVLVAQFIANLVMLSTAPQVLKIAVFLPVFAVFLWNLRLAFPNTVTFMLHCLPLLALS